MKLIRCPSRAICLELITLWLICGGSANRWDCGNFRLNFQREFHVIMLHPRTGYPAYDNTGQLELTQHVSSGLNLQNTSPSSGTKNSSTFHDSINMLVILHCTIYLGAATAQSVERLATSWSSSPGRVKNCLFSTSSRLILGSTQPLFQWVSEALSPEVKRTGCEAHHSPTSAEVK
jgi:hypothetical protein